MRCEYCPNGHYGYNERDCIACWQEEEQIEEQYIEFLTREKEREEDD